MDSSSQCLLVWNVLLCLDVELLHKFSIAFCVFQKEGVFDMPVKEQADYNDLSWELSAR